MTENLEFLCKNRHSQLAEELKIGTTPFQQHCARSHTKPHHRLSGSVSKSQREHQNQRDMERADPSFFQIQFQIPLQIPTQTENNKGNQNKNKDSLFFPISIEFHFPPFPLNSLFHDSNFWFLNYKYVSVIMKSRK